MSEYGAESPIWVAGNGMVYPKDIGLSEQLSADLFAWEDHFLAHFDHEAGWDDQASRKWYAEEAECLRQAVARELGDEVAFTVSLWPLEV